MFVVVTNCICYGLQIDPAWLYRGGVQHSLLTDGLLRLLSGEYLAPMNDSDPVHRFDPIDPAKVEAIVWSPFIDQAGYYIKIKNHDGTLFPWHDTLLYNTVGGDVGRVPLSTVYLWWRELDRLTAGVQKRLLVTYPPVFLADDTVVHCLYRQRIITSTQAALEIFASWKHFTVADPVLADTWWAHFTLESRALLLRMLEHELMR